MKTIELIVPCYNEEKCIALFCENVKKVFIDMPEYDFIITYIDDGSKDSTLEEIKKVVALENTGGGILDIYRYRATSERKQLFMLGCPR